MSMGFYANWAHVIEDDFIKEHAKEEYDALETFLLDHESGMEEFMRENTYDTLPDIFNEDGDTSEELDAECKELSKALCDKFMEATNLSLYSAYHDEGGRGDMVSGVFWCVSGVFDRTPAGEKYKDRIKDNQSWVECG